MILNSKGVAICIIGLFAMAIQSFAEDAPPVNSNALLGELRHLSDQRDKHVKQQRQGGFGPSFSSSRQRGSGGGALGGRSPRGSVRRRAEGKRRVPGLEGESRCRASRPGGKSAARLFLSWLSLTMQREAGASVKDLLPRLIAYTQDLAADRRMADALGDSIDKQKEAAQGGRHAVPQPKPTSEQVKRMHDQILNTALAGSAVVQWLNLGPFVQVEKWEAKPGNLDGIFTNIILPELRAGRDPRAGILGHAVERGGRKSERLQTFLRN